MEAFLARAERVVDHALAGTLPPFIDDPSECRRCPFMGATCQPNLSAQEIRVLTDPELEAELHRWHELKPAGKEWADLDGRIKKRLRGVMHAIAGPFTISGRWGKSSRTDLPAAIKKQYTVTDDQGRFFLEVEKL
jgi:hypothetical protein